MCTFNVFRHARSNQSFYLGGIFPKDGLEFCLAVPSVVYYMMPEGLFPLSCLYAGPPSPEDNLLVPFFPFISPRYSHGVLGPKMYKDIMEQNLMSFG